MGTENRKQKRIPFNQHVLINNSIMLNTVDISEGGVYVHTDRMFQVGSTLDISVSIGSHKVDLKAHVEHCQAGIGMGLQFADMSAERQVELKNFLTELEKKTSVSSKKRILIVDDNDAVRRMNKSKLILDGFTVLEARNGVEAIKILQAEHLDLAVFDLFMEPMDGFKLTALIRQMPQHKDIPVIVFSARSTPDVIEQAKNAGATIFLPKTITSPIKMSENVKKLLEK
ncbi:MAG: response regulator [Nitrospirae bacterium]|nr:response regulator [Nitrospirota bacterium]